MHSIQMLINIYLNHCYGFCYGMGFFNILWKWNIGHLSSRPKEISIEYQCKKISIKYQCKVPSLVAQMVKNPPAMWETSVWSLGWDNPLEEEMATHSSILAWEIPWTEEPGKVQSIVLQKIVHDWATKHTHIRNDGLSLLSCSVFFLFF